MTGEGALLAGLLVRLEQLRVGYDEALGLVGALPMTADRFARLDVVERTATTALLKRTEQMQDLLARTFRTLLRIMAVDTEGLFARDYANLMEKHGLVDSADDWTAVTNCETGSPTKIRSAVARGSIA